MTLFFRQLMTDKLTLIIRSNEYYYKDIQVVESWRTTFFLFVFTLKEEEERRKKERNDNIERGVGE